MSRANVLALVGPTASGKTQVSIELARLLNGEIVSADSRQVYRYLDIGTAKPTAVQLAKAVHHFIGVLDPTEEYSAGRYGSEARETIKRIMNAGRLPIVVGGSGLYVKAAIDGLFDGPARDEEIRSRLEMSMREHGAESLLQTLRKVDPEAAAKMDSRKPRRIIRALEVYYITGKPLSRHLSEQDSRPQFGVVQFGLQWSRSDLYANIDRRVDGMMAEGLVEEVRGLKRNGYDTRLNSLNTVGYKEVFDHLDGRADEATTIELIKRNTRRFAKRQLTWFRADKRILWVGAESQKWGETAKKIASMFRKSD